LQFQSDTSSGKRDSALDWQKQAIDRAMPLMKDLAANTSAAIQHPNENKLRPIAGSYPEYLKENTETAQELSSMISNFVRYGETRARLENSSSGLKSHAGEFRS
jgi:hypothetical protein